MKKLLYSILIILFMVPSVSGQKIRDVEIVLECVEYIGNDRYAANFGYNNPNKTEVVVAETNSLLVYDNGQPGIKALNKFLPGRQTNAFRGEFSAQSRVQWQVTLPNGTVKKVTANINSNHCTGSNNILPYYPPPSGGKLTHSILGPELYSLYQSYLSSGTAVSNFIYQVSGSNVLIEIKVISGCYNQIVNSLTGDQGFDLVFGEEGANLLTGWLPIGNLINLDNFVSCIEYVRPVFPSLLENSGIALNKGDFAIRSDFVRNGYSISGQGVKIGVLSDSYNTKGVASLDVQNGDLPGMGNIDGNLQPVEVLKDYPYTFSPMSDEGRAMLQIIHDIAPKADLAFRTGYISPGDMAAGIGELADAGCDIIVDDISFITEPFFRDGKIATAVNNAVSRGVTYFSSAGNYGNKSWSDFFNPQSANLSGNLSGNFHNFGNGDIYQNISLAAGNYIIVMQWEDAVQATNDFDIYLANTNGTILFGFNRNNLGTEPVEVLPFTVTSGGATTNILIHRAAGVDNPRVKYMVFRGDLVINEYKTGTATIVSHANSEGAITVGAVKYDNTPYYGVNPPTIASFSSIGGVPVNGIVRQKPDITAPNGVNTTVKLSDFDLDGDGNYEFYGTSAAAPHAAAVAALLKEAKAKYESDVLTPEQTRQLLQTTAIDMNQTGFDFTSGFGFIQADKAIQTLANAKPELSKLIVPDGINPGTDGFTVTATGNYLSEGTQIIMDGAILETEFISETTVGATVPLFNGNPSLIAYTPPKSINQNDGGYSDPVYFFGITKKNLVIKSDNRVKKYGEQLPSFSFTMTADGEPFSRGDLTDAEFNRINDVLLSTSATSLSDAGTYIIRPSLVPAIGSVTDPSDPLFLIDKSLAEKFTFKFEDGVLTIEKLHITITPSDLTRTYGETITASDITFSYDPDFTGLNITESDKLTILNSAREEHAGSLTDHILFVDGTTIFSGIPLVNGIPLLNLNGIALINGHALVNGIEVTVENGITYLDGTPVASGIPVINGIPMVNGIPLVNALDVTTGQVLFNNAIIGISGQTIISVDGIALPNAIPLVNGVPLVNGIALVNGVEVSVASGVALINNQIISGTTVVNGIPVINGIPLVNSAFITDGTVLINDLPVSIANGIPLVNGIPMVNGTPLVNGIALVNALNEFEVVNLADVNMLVSGTALVNALADLNGTPLVNGIPLLNGIEANISDESLLVAVNHTNPDGIVTDPQGNVLKNGVPVINGIGLVNGVALVNGIALINGINASALVNGIALINSETINSTSNSGSVLIFDNLDLSSTVPPGFMPVSFITGNTVGMHWIVPGTFLSNNFNISYGLGILTVEKALLTVTADDHVIFAGELLPAITFSFSGFLPGDTPESVFGTDGPDYKIIPGYTGDAGTYQIMPVGMSTNYVINGIAGTLYVNPAPVISKAVRPVLVCIEVMDPVLTGYAYSAHFRYENPNNTDVFIPVGENNRITGKGNFDVTQQPSLFLKGGGDFWVPFDGQKLVWELKSVDSGRKAAVSSVASSTSSRCSAKSAPIPQAGIETSDLLYPNPATEKVTLLVNDVTEGTVIRVTDIRGVSWQVSKTVRDDFHLELDIRLLPTGLYIISVSDDSTKKQFRMIKK